jgi:hypothetical protein
MTAPQNSSNDAATHSTWNHSRRRILAAGVALATSLAGCLGGDGGGDDGPQRPEAIEGDGRVSARVENPPDAVYKPTHVQSVKMLDQVRVGDFAVLPHYTIPHQFWLMRGSEREEVLPDAGGLHFMLAFWDAQTREILPVDAGQRVEIRRDGEIVEPPFQPWPMISQQMGFHFGDNVTFPEAGTYTLEVQMGPIDTRKTGAFAGRFEETVSTSFEFDYDPSLAEEVVADLSYLDESEWGEPGAVPLMGSGGGMEMGGGSGGGTETDGESDGGTETDGESDGGMEMDGNGPPDLSLPGPSEYPGQDLGTYTSHDAQFVVRYLDESRLAPDGEGYLLVSPRTPYNRVPLPQMSLDVEGDVEGALTQTLDSEVGHHYGRPAALAPGDSFDIVVGTPPQVARHRGYETAFLAMDPMTVEVPSR